MNLRFYGMAIGTLALLFVTCGGVNPAAAQQDANNQDQPMMTPLNGVVTEYAKQSQDSINSLLRLEMFDAAVGGLSLCAGDNECLKHVNGIKSWICFASACEGADKSKKPLDCSKDIADQYPNKDTQDEINSSICALIKSPGAETRKALLSYDPEDNLVEYGAYLMALKGSAGACEDYIKNYVGAYGPSWNYKWYKAMSGCRILGGASTRQLEEKNFYTWYEVLQGKGSCSGIYISEMRNACSAPGATSPFQ